MRFFIFFIRIFWAIQQIPVCPASGVVSSPYGAREDPFTHKRSFHGGTDIANAEGTPVHAPWRGEVLRVGFHKSSGRFVSIRTGKYRISFMHLQKVKVKKGEIISRGQVLALMGSTGRATRPHLHVEVRAWGRKPRIDPYFLIWTCF